MQTFLPYPDLVASLEVLDDKRLGKQRVETFQILKALRGESKGWVNHPATKMWRGCEPMLEKYLNLSIQEWISRGKNNNMAFVTLRPGHNLYPVWFGNEDFHRSHRSNLLRKDPDHYRQFWPNEPDDLPYIWP